MVLQYSRTFLALIAGVTFLLTFSSVRVLSDLIAAHHTASGVVEGVQSGEWGRFIGQTEANIGSHIPHILHRGEVQTIKGAEGSATTFYILGQAPSGSEDSFK